MKHNLRWSLATFITVCAISVIPVFSEDVAPDVTTGPGAGVGITVAVLHGSLTAGTSAHIWVHWGPADQDVPPAASATGLVATSTDAPYDFKYTLSGLTAATTYAYRIAASNDQDVVESSWVWFTTRPADFVTVTEPAWFGGGWHDGYDEVRGLSAPDYPQVHNAMGATNMTTTNAWLNGMLTHSGTPAADVWVFWGITDGETDVALWTNSHEFGSQTEFDLLSHEIPVDEGFNYYYRFFATNTAGQTGWAPVTAMFQSPAPPAVTTGPGAGVGITRAVLNGEITAGIEAQVWFEWGPAAGGDPPISTDSVDMGVRTVIATPGVDNPFKYTISGLDAAGTYAYRVTASNSFGVAESPWTEFTTQPEDFVWTPTPAWFGGGWHDGFDAETQALLIEQLSRGTLFMFR